MLLVSKIYSDSSCIYHYIEKNEEWNVNFVQNISLGTQNTSVLSSSRLLIVVLVLWLSRVFPASWLINSLCAHVVFKRATDGGWHNLSGISDDRCGSLEQVAWVLATQRQEKISVNN